MHSFQVSRLTLKPGYAMMRLPRQGNPPSGIYQLEMDGKLISAGRAKAGVPICGGGARVSFAFGFPEVNRRSAAIARLGLVNSSGAVLHDASVGIEVFRDRHRPIGKSRSWGIEVGRPRG